MHFINQERRNLLEVCSEHIKYLHFSLNSPMIVFIDRNYESFDCD